MIYMYFPPIKLPQTLMLITFQPSVPAASVLRRDCLAVPRLKCPTRRASPKIQTHAKLNQCLELVEPVGFQKAPGNIYIYIYIYIYNRIIVEAHISICICIHIRSQCFTYHLHLLSIKVILDHVSRIPSIGPPFWGRGRLQFTQAMLAKKCSCSRAWSVVQDIRRYSNR